MITGRVIIDAGLTPWYIGAIVAAGALLFLVYRYANKN